MQPFFTPPGEAALRGVMQLPPDPGLRLRRHAGSDRRPPGRRQGARCRFPRARTAGAPPSRGHHHRPRRGRCASAAGLQPQLRDRQPRRRRSADYAAPAISARRSTAARAHRTAIAARCATPASRSRTSSLSLALHYRRAADPQARAGVHRGAALGIDAGPRRFGGKCVVNIVAAGLPDKGDALVDLMRRAEVGAAVFVGDDVNDEAVFERAEPHWLTLRIGRRPAVARDVLSREQRRPGARARSACSPCNRDPAARP